MDRGEDDGGYISHLTILVSKAETRFYHIESVVAYDKAVRQPGAMDGMDTLKEIDSILVMRHLFYHADVKGCRQSQGATGMNNPRKEGFCPMLQSCVISPNVNITKLWELWSCQPSPARL